MKRSVLTGLLFWGCALAASAQQCQLEVSTARPILPADEKTTTCVKVGVTGFEMESEAKRPDLNIALVLDKSGSMNGEKIQRAKEAARCAVEAMKSDDIISVVLYSSEAEVLVPATKAGDKKEILAKIDEIQAGGTTALYAGTELGAQEVQKFYDKKRVNRVVLLSDGLANVGPSSVEEIGKLGQKLGGEGICVTTLGLGSDFNEDLMTKLSQTSDGNHVFISQASNLVEVFNEEFQTAVKVVASEVSCQLICAKGIRPIRVLNRDAEISGQNVTFGWNQIYSGHQRYAMIEVEVPAGEEGETRTLATAHLTYANMKTNATDELSAAVDVKFSGSEEEVKKAVVKNVMEEYILQRANQENKRAIELRDSGDIAGARSALRSNSAFLRENAQALGGSDVLIDAAEMNSSQESSISDNKSWGVNRKMMRALGSASESLQMSPPID